MHQHGPHCEHKPLTLVQWILVGCIMFAVVGGIAWFRQANRPVPAPVNPLEAAIAQATNGKDLTTLELGVITKDNSQYYLVRPLPIGIGLMGELPPGVKSVAEQGGRKAIVFFKRDKDAFVILVCEKDKDANRYVVSGGGFSTETQPEVEKILADENIAFHEKLNRLLRKL